MIKTYPPIHQALLGTCFTWFVTALGSAVVFLEPILPGGPDAHQKFLDTMLGFAGGVMMAASYWSLLAPAIDMSEKDWYGKSIFMHIELPNGIEKDVTYAWMPAAVGFGAGGLFLILGDWVRGYSQLICKIKGTCDSGIPCLVYCLCLWCARFRVCAGELAGAWQMPGFS